MTTDVLRRPPSADGLGRGTALALLVHVGLVLALAWGVSWRRSDPTPASAELWSAVPTVADAPAPPPPQPVVPPVPRVVPPKPVIAPKPAPTPAPPARDADIATEKKPKKKEEPKREEPKKEEPKKAEVKKPEPKPEPKKEPEKQQAAEAARAQQLREEQMRRLNAQLLGAGGAGSGGGTAAQSSGPSASYAGRIVARIRPNIIFNGQVSGHPKAEVLVRVAPDGTILGSKLTKPSGIAEWDDAVLRAIERTQVLPRDVDGRVPPEIPISFDPNER